MLGLIDAVKPLRRTSSKNARAAAQFQKSMNSAVDQLRMIFASESLADMPAEGQAVKAGSRRRCQTIKSR